MLHHWFFPTFLGSSLILWHRKCQGLVSHSNTKSEYWAMAGTTIELELSTLFCKISVALFLLPPLYIMIIKVVSPFPRMVFHERTKHIEVDCHIVQQEHVVAHITLFPVFFKDQVRFCLPRHKPFLTKLPISDST